MHGTRASIPFGVNVFAQSVPIAPERYRQYAALMQAETEPLRPHAYLTVDSDDEFDAKIALLERPVARREFSFGIRRRP